MHYHMLHLIIFNFIKLLFIVNQMHEATTRWSILREFSQNIILTQDFVIRPKMVKNLECS